MSDIIAPKNRVSKEDANDPGLEVGQWYWIDSTEHDENDYKILVTKKRLACIIHVGSNYAKLEDPNSYTWRVHFDNFAKTCTRETSAEFIIKDKILKHQRETQQLMEQVRDLTARLGVPIRPSLSDGNETQAISVHGSAQPVEDYKQALIQAEKETLPDLFAQIKKSNEKLARWMKAPLIPVVAAAENDATRG